MSERYEGWDAHDLRDHLLQVERELNKALRLLLEWRRGSERSPLELKRDTDELLAADEAGDGIGNR